MAWTVLLGDEFEGEFLAMPVAVRREALAIAGLLQQFGPGPGRPHVDTLKGSKHANMKEMRFNAEGGVWRLAFAFDPKRQAILLIAGDKSGGGDRRFYVELISRADARFDAHLQRLRKKQAEDGASSASRTKQKKGR